MKGVRASGPDPAAAPWVLWAAVALVPLAVYVATLCPTVGAGDAGELTVVAHTLGVTHARVPTGSSADSARDLLRALPAAP